MIPIQRLAAPASTHALLDRRSAKVAGRGGTVEVARSEWDNAAAAKRDVRQLLEQMAHGVQRCMYCEDSLGTDIDHFQPIASAPLRAFVWVNHLLACSHCNSNHKRDSYPCTSDGHCLLVDPSVEDPAAHLTLLLASGEYRARSIKGKHTIAVFGLNRGDLVQGRAAAFMSAKAQLHYWHHRWKEGDISEADKTVQALRVSPFAGVVRTMERLEPAIAATVLGSDTLAVLEEWRVRHR